MQIFVNGEQHEVADGMKMAALVNQLGLEGQRLAVEVNEELVPRSSFADYELKAQDAIEIIHAVGGG